jgi:tetratricopeptide (TPR) repeat protein
MTSALQHSAVAPAGEPSRNAACPCGSGEKYKRCCGAVSDSQKIPGAPPGRLAVQNRFNHAVQLLRAGQPHLAMPVLIEVINADPQHFDATLALGSALMQAGRFADAAAILSHAVALNPASAPAYRDLGAAYDTQNLHEQAIAAFQKAVELAPKLADIHIRLGQLYAMYSRPEEASACFDRAADARPNTTLARLLRSDARLLRNDMPAAEQWARKAIALEPNSDAAHGALGGLLYNQGCFEAAAACFETALRHNPIAGKYWDGLARCRKYAIPATAMIARMREVLQRADLPAHARMTIHFALGKVFDDCGDYAHAMEQFVAANALRANTVAFDRAALAAQIDRNIRYFTPASVARATAAVGTAASKPVFIVGTYRSGTTLVEQILSSHPAIAAGGELTVWGPMDLEIDPATGELNPALMPGAAAKYLAALERIGPTAQHVTDKLPSNFLRLGAIHALFPNAPIVHCQRDPIDTCLSIYSTHFATPLPFAAKLDDLVFYYQQYRRMMEHWRNVLPPHALLELQYERLIADRDAATRRLIAFTGLGWNDACLTPEQNARPISTASTWQARQPVYATSMQRWRHYEPWIGALLPLQPAAPS